MDYKQEIYSDYYDLLQVAERNFRAEAYIAKKKCEKRVRMVQNGIKITIAILAFILVSRWI